MADSPSVVDVAARAGVSLGTVSNVLNHPERVSAATRKRVTDAIEELGFVRNEAARQLRAGRSRTIGLIVLDIGNPFFTDLASGVEVAATEAGLSLVICDSGDDLEREKRYLALLHEQRSLGILITPVAGQGEHLQEIRRHGTPVVLVDRGSSPSECSVTVNDRVGGELAVAHLSSLGHTKIAFVGGPMSIRQVGDRLDGGRHAARAAGLAASQPLLIETEGLNVASGREAGRRIAEMGARSRPTGVFCANDLIALGVLQEMTRRRLRVPDDLAIVGYDDIDFAAAAAVPLTSVAQPRAQLGAAAAELLIQEASAPETHRHRQVVFEPELVIRDSTSPC